MYKLKKKGIEYMREIIESLNDMSGQEVKIYTDHKLFGKQQIEMQLEPETDLGVGFCCKGQSIYIENDDIVDYKVDKNNIVMNGSLMKIHIVQKISK